MKNAFSDLSFRKQKGASVFHLQEDINVVLITAPSSTKPGLSFLKFQFLAKIFRETFIMSLKSTSFPKELLLSPEQNDLKEIWDTVLTVNETKDDNTIIIVPPNISCTFLLFKVSRFLQIFFPRKSKFWERHFFSIVNVWHSLPY